MSLGKLVSSGVIGFGLAFGGYGIGHGRGMAEGKREAEEAYELCVKLTSIVSEYRKQNEKYFLSLKKLNDVVDDLVNEAETTLREE